MATDLGSLRLYTRYDEGEGPVMVLLHGINSDATDWRVIIDTIGSGYRFIALDLLGFGESPKPTDIEYTADEHAQVLDATLKDLGVTKPFLLVGYSLGGDIAIRYASKHPKKLRRLFLLSTPFYLPPEAFEGQGFGVQYLQVIIFQRVWKMIASQKKQDTLLYQIANGKAEDFAKGFLRTDDVPTHWDIMSKNLRNCIGKATFVGDLPKLDMPVTFALGIRDPIVHPDQTPDLKRLKPEIDIRRIVGLSADHFMLVNLPETVAAEIMRDEIDSLHVRMRAGNGEDPVVFLHGFADDPRYFAPIAAALTERHEVALVDLLGFGESPKPLSSRYTIYDHADAVVHTIEKEFGGKPVRLVGHAFGSLVALEVARVSPGLVTDVTVFSPLAVAPGADIETTDPSFAAVMALRDRAKSSASDPRAAAGIEASAEHILPLLRSLDQAVLGSDLDHILDGLPCPVRVIDPGGSEYIDDSYVGETLRKHPEVVVDRVDAAPTFPLDDPARAASLLDPQLSATALARAEKVRKPKDRAELKSARGVFASISNQIALKGAAMLVLGLVVLSLQTLPTRLISVGFAIWIFVEGFTTISGAVGLRREGKNGWIAWLLLGALSGVVGVLLFLRPELNLQILALFIAARAIYIGAANLYIARRVSQTPTPRWLLVLEGIFGLFVAGTLIFAPGHGAVLVKYVLAGYLLASGASSLGYALLARRAVKKRIDAAIAKDRAQVHGTTTS